MRVRTSGVIRRVDLSPAIALIPPLLAEWSALRFDATGSLVNPMTGATALLLTLHADDPRRLAFRVEDHHRPWWVDFEITHGRLPHLAAVGEIDVATTLRANRSGCLSPFIGRRGEARIEIDLGVVERGEGSLVDGAGRLGRSHATGRVQLTTTASEWAVDARLRVRGRGLVRFLLLVTRHRVRRRLRAQFDNWWASAPDRSRALDAWMSQLASDTASAGGPASYVHRTLWSPGPPTHRP